VLILRGFFEGFKGGRPGTPYKVKQILNIYSTSCPNLTLYIDLPGATRVPMKIGLQKRHESWNQWTGMQVRTIGVLTKLDPMDQGAEAVRMVRGEENPPALWICGGEEYE